MMSLEKIGVLDLTYLIDKKKKRFIPLLFSLMQFVYNQK